MHDFVYIKTLFPEIQREIVSLSEVYNNDNLLYNILKEITKLKFTTQNIKGKRVLLKPNWVKHNSKKEDELCLTTHFNFLLVLIKIISEFGPEKITIGDAPIQGCRWEELIPPNFVNKVQSISKNSHVPIFIKDFRRVKFDPEHNVVEKGLIDLDDFVIFDLGKESYLEPITEAGKNKFRVTQYDPDRFLESHKPGMHKYCITREVFNADIVISVPKLKTHQKAGITAALKNIVGINGDKDFLPHHRIGGTEMGGDSYPGNNCIRRLAEYFFDLSYKNQGGYMYRFWARMGSLTWKFSLPAAEHQPGAAWHGNDTVWRMVMDLNTIIYYGKEDGTIQKEKRRDFFSLGDGIIGGQGDGPLNPDPLPLGVVTFTNNSVWHDICVSELMGFDFYKIKLLKEGLGFSRGSMAEIILNGHKIKIKDLNKTAIKTQPPPGWVKHLKL